MYCRNLEVMSSNPGRVELGVRSTSVLSRTKTYFLNLQITPDQTFTFTFTYPIVMNRRGATGVLQLATNSLHSSRLSTFLKVSLSSNPVHFLTLSSHLFFFCLPLFLPPHTVPCNMVFASPDDLVTCPYHFSFRSLIVVRKSSSSHQKQT